MKKINITMIAMALAVAATAQGPLQLSLQQAMDLAAKQSYAVQASSLETEKARSKVKEITAIGLPQINGSANITNYIDVPTTLIPNFFSAPGEGPEFIAASFGVPWSMNAGISVSQLLFDGSYLVGLKASRTFAESTQLDLQKAEADARNQAAKAYFGVLAAEEGVRLAGEGIPILEKTHTEVRAMLDAGMAEQTDVDRITIQVEQIKAQQRSFKQQADVARMLLALTLGVPLGTPITTTDKLETILNDAGEMGLTEQQLESGSHVEMMQANTLVELQTLNVKNEKSKAMPNLVGFFNYQQQWYGPEFEPFGGPYDWYPATLWGVTLNVPIFSSGSRIHKVKQARLALDQVNVNRTATDERLKTMVEQQRSTARTAVDNLETEKRTMDLAKNIFDRTSIKFTNGSAASFELTQEQGNYLLAQQTYVQRLVELLMARADLRKALDLY
jgi:outer membrane protein